MTRVALDTNILAYVAGVERHADDAEGTMDVHANTGGAERDINHTARTRSSTINANAATWSAENQLNWLARNRTSTITVRTSGAGGGVRDYFGTLVPE